MNEYVLFFISFMFILNPLAFPPSFFAQTQWMYSSFGHLWKHLYNILVLDPRPLVLNLAESQLNNPLGLIGLFVC